MKEDSLSASSRRTWFRWLRQRKSNGCDAADHEHGGEEPDDGGATVGFYEPPGCRSSLLLVLLCGAWHSPHRWWITVWLHLLSEDHSEMCLLRMRIDTEWFTC